MKGYFCQLAWICVLLCGNASGQTATYTVKPGDSLSKIARSQGCTVEALAKTNGIKLSAVIQAGQKLKLPGKAGTITSGGSHIIQPGDTFSSISRQYNISMETLIAANAGLDPKALKPGQKILLLAGASPAAAANDTPRKSDPTEPSVAPSNTVSPSAERVANASNLDSQEGKTGDSKVPSSSQPPRGKIRTVVVDLEITFGEFAGKHGSDIQRLNELNGLDLTASTVLAKGSELYVPVAVEDEPQR